MQYDELEKKFKGKTIDELAKPFQQMHELAMRLYYLKESGRWKECPDYNDKSFEQFVEGALKMNLKDYDYLVFLYWPREEGKSSAEDPASHWRYQALQEEERRKKAEIENAQLRLQLGKEKIH
jgi:hypothetical protein